jgi:ketosteroid isomerase-like protein
MRKTLFPFSMVLFCLVFCSCKLSNPDLNEEAKKEIGLAEKNFAKMASEKGIAEAFWYYADSNAVIRRSNDSVIRGREAIRNFYSSEYFREASVTWSPDFIDAAENGDFGYTFGKFKWVSKDSSGKINESKGIFHTVWKKQKDGSWKYVFD